MGAKLGRGIKTAAKWGAAVGAAAIAVGAAMLGAANKVAGAADEIDKASRRAGTNAEEWQKLKYAMGQSGIDASTLEKTMVKNQKTLNEAAQGTGKAVEAYASLGVSIKNVDGSLRASDEVYKDALKSLADLTDINERNRIANDLFGKSYAELAPILDGGSAGIDALTSRAEQLGLVMSQETVDAGVKFGDTLDDLKQVGGAAFNMFAAELLPILQVFLEFLIAAAPKIQEAINFIMTYIESTMVGIKEIWSVHGESIISIAKFYLDALKQVIEVAMEVVKNVIDVVMGLIEGDWDRVWKGLSGAVESAFKLIATVLEIQAKLILNVLKAVGEWLFNAGKQLFERLWDGMKETWQKMVGWIKQVGREVVDAITFWDNAKPQSKPNDSARVSGRHASGLAYVPYDGYIAELHRGERVLTADESEKKETQSSNNTYNFTFNSPKQLSTAEARREATRAYRDMLLGF